MKKFPLLLLILMAGLSLGAQTSDFALIATPTLNIPLGPSLEDGTSFYAPIGGGISLKADYILPFAPFLYAGAAFDVDLAAVNSAKKLVTFLSLGPGLGVILNPIPRLVLKMGAYGGYYAGITEAGTVINPFVSALADLSFLMNPSLSIGVGAGYKVNFTPTEPVYQGIGISLGVRYNIGAGNRQVDLEIRPRMEPIFPLFFSYYDKNPAGSVTVVNNERDAIQDLEVSFYVKQYMDQPKQSAGASELKRGQELELPVYALFTEEIFKITEGTKVAGEIIVGYRYLGREMTNSIPITVSINNRNAMTWDDTNKAAAFVSAKDPVVLTFAKQVAGSVNSEGNMAINTNFRIGMGIFEALSLFGIGYVVDPVTPYSELSENKSVVDFLQFPNQTLAYKAGDCDDISVLYSALLEAVGIRTAFITAPGHIYMAFALGIEPEAAKRNFLDPDNLLFMDGDTWIPVEITLVEEGFLKAWQIGAKEWRETSANGTAGFYPVRQAWETYEPVGFSEGVVAVVMPDSENLVRVYSDELYRFINAEVEPKARDLREQIREDDDNLALINKLGVLYAKFGLLDKAALEFKRIVRTGEYAAALVNLGNIYYLKDEMPTALDYYGRALEKAPQNSVALLGLAKASYETEDYASVDSALAQLEELDPAAADKFSYLSSGADTGSRASSAATKEISAWDEE